MKLDFNLVRFRYDRIHIKSEATAIVFCFSQGVAIPFFELHGEEKISAFSREIISKLNSDNPEIFILCLGCIPIAVSPISPSCPENSGNVNMNALDYLLVHSSTKYMNGLMDLETLNTYMNYLVCKFGTSSLL